MILLSNTIKYCNCDI